MDDGNLVYLHWLVQECGYLNVTPLPGNRWAAVQPKLFTHAVVLGRIGDYAGIDDLWCYNALVDAKAALDRWDGKGAPVGWIGHPPTGRRLSRTGAEIDDSGFPVGAIGVIYSRT